MSFKSDFFFSLHEVQTPELCLILGIYIFLPFLGLAATIMENISVSFTFLQNSQHLVWLNKKYFGVDLNDLLQIDSRLATGKTESPVARG